MFVGRHERVLAIDGDYIHIMPPENKTFFDNIKTVMNPGSTDDPSPGCSSFSLCLGQSSFHINTVISCKQNKKGSTAIKLLCQRDRDTKAYDLECNTPQEAGKSMDAG
jgi:hypothetical protein